MVLAAVQKRESPHNHEYEMQKWRYPVIDASRNEEIISFPTAASSYTLVETDPSRLDSNDS